MGGEYLPDYLPTEVEVARIDLQSIMRDAISIRACRDPKGSRYRVVDEYETPFVLARETSRRAFTLKELIGFIDRSRQPELSRGLATCYNKLNADFDGRESLQHFTQLSSDFYPQLGEHYGHVFEEWVRKGEKTEDEVED